jgi:hypothetical protein
MNITKFLLFKNEAFSAAMEKSQLLLCPLRFTFALNVNAGNQINIVAPPGFILTCWDTWITWPRTAAGPF